jgi:demethylmenaquinone methyltransferase / 2-methoxy-6-polyprenyl-1,4-benzoquinol methylase
LELSDKTSSFTFPSQKDKAGYVHCQFERLAAKYDFANDVISFGMHRLWKEQAVECLNCFPEGSYLDVCCGTGDLALRIAGKLASVGSVTGLDFSESMLSVARSRTVKTKIKCELAWVAGDAQSLPFATNSFDGAVISFGLRNLTDYALGIREMARVVKPGARVVNLDLGRTDLPVFAQLFSFYFGKIVPLLGQIIQRDHAAYTYLPESAKRYLKPEEVTSAFKEAGLIDVGYLPLAGGSVALHWGTAI